MKTLFSALLVSTLFIPTAYAQNHRQQWHMNGYNPYGPYRHYQHNPHRHHHRHNHNILPYIAGGVGIAILGGIMYDRYGRKCYDKIVGYTRLGEQVVTKECW